MNASSTPPWMIGSAQATSVSGAVEIPSLPSRDDDPDPADTVRLPIFERSIRRMPAPP